MQDKKIHPYEIKITCVSTTCVSMKKVVHITNKKKKEINTKMSTTIVDIPDRYYVLEEVNITPGSTTYII